MGTQSGLRHCSRISRPISFGMLIGRVPSIFCDDCANYDDTYSTPSHCNTCKELSGATYTLNQIIPAKALKITKGDDLGKYTYKGDSGS